MNLELEKQMNAVNRSHRKPKELLLTLLEKAKQKIISRGDLEHISAKSQVEILDDLYSTPMGRHIINTKGANGYWTDYMIYAPLYEGTPPKDNGSIEYFLRYRSPHVRAQRELFQIFISEANKLLKDNMTIASIPCGVMRDLLSLDLERINGYQLVGIDIDSESLALAQNNTQEQGVECAKFYRKDAWNLDMPETFDLINSIGLNVYENDPEQVINLYKQFYASLKPGGVLITGVLTYPPGHAEKSDWVLAGIPKQELFLEEALHKDILDINWQNFKHLDEIADDFKKAGFSEVTIIPDKHRIFPAVIAKK